MCPYAVSTMSNHAADESVDVVLGDLLLDLDQGVSELFLFQKLKGYFYTKTAFPPSGLILLV